jgi:hypothetical protein
MKKNMALGDRILRMATGLILIVVILFKTPGQVMMYAMIALAFYLMTTAWIGHCGIYNMFGIDTRQFREGDPYNN